MMWAMEQQATLKLLWKMTRNFWEWTPFLHQLITCKQCRGWKSLLEVWISSCKKYCSLSFHDSHVFSWYWPLNFKPYTCVGAQKVEENCIYISLSRMMKKYLEITSVPSNHVFPLKIQKLKNGMPLRVGYHIMPHSWASTLYIFVVDDLQKQHQMRPWNKQLVQSTMMGMKDLLNS